jgi:hypothetical protein
MHLKLDGIKGEKTRSSVVLGDLDGDGTLDITATGDVDVSGSNWRMPKIIVKYEPILSRSIPARSIPARSIAARSIPENSRMSFELFDSTGELCDISAQGNVSFRGDGLRYSKAHIKLDWIKRESTRSSVMLADSTFDGLTLSTGDGEDMVALARVTVLGDLSVATGGGNDAARCVDCVFDGQSLFDGGSGEDALAMTSTRFARRPKLLGWEKMKLSDVVH